MNKRKIALKPLLSVFLFIFCPIPVFSQNAVTLDRGLGNAVKYFAERLEKGNKIAVLNFSAPTARLAEYVAEELTANFVNDGSWTVVDRNNLELLQQEMQFQLSGEVDDDTVLSIGRKLGAQIIISGSMEAVGNLFRLRVRAISVETAAIKGINTANIQRDRILASLAETPPAASAAETSPAPAGKPPANSGSGGSGGGRSLPGYLLSPP
ncbi:MAG: CsgG/HfaB family protein [Spirochaetaceae bacterium]|jgi:TolB-like protein|nr:CsgG/HfaB family protein [Spirochaetaceae bacterium]